MDDRYKADLRLKEIEEAINKIRRDGLAVGYRDGKLYVENTIACHQTLDYKNKNNSATLELGTSEENNPMIDGESHYFIQMRPLHQLPLIGWGMRCSSDKEKWVECTIEPENYGKIRAVALEEGYGSEKYYVMDFESMVRNGYIIKKTSPNQRVEKLTWFEPIPNTGACYRNEAWVVTEN